MEALLEKGLAYHDYATPEERQVERTGQDLPAPQRRRQLGEIGIGAGTRQESRAVRTGAEDRQALLDSEGQRQVPLRKPFSI